MKHLVFILLLSILSASIFAVTATWTGSTSVNWDTPSNWSTGALPSSTTDVFIPNTTNKPRITWANAVCNDITIQPSTTLLLNSAAGFSLTVNGVMTVNGALSLTGSGAVSLNGVANCYGVISVTGTGGLTAYQDIHFYSGSSFVDSSDTQFQVHRDLYIYDGASFIMNHGGRTNFVGTISGNIRNFSSATQFGYFIAAKSSATAYVNINAVCTENFKVNNDLINYANNELLCQRNLTITVLGNVIDYNAADTAGDYGIKWNTGGIKMDGTSQSLSMQGLAAI